MLVLLKGLLPAFCYRLSEPHVCFPISSYRVEPVVFNLDPTDETACLFCVDVLMCLCVSSLIFWQHGSVVEDSDPGENLLMSEFQLCQYGLG